MKFVKDLNEYPAWRSVFGPPNNRAKDEELIIRFMALYVASNRYARPMNGFLNRFSAEMNKSPPERLNDLGAIFTKTIDKVNSAIGARAFRIIRALNAAAFDSIMVGLARRLESEPAPSDDSVLIAYEKLVALDDFRKLCERATADEENVRKRIELSTAAFAGI
jgi:hypothetical protein